MQASMRYVTVWVHQLHYESRIFTRNMVGAFFTIALPLFMLLLFNGMLGDSRMRAAGGIIEMSRFYVPAFCAFAVVGACYTHIAMTVTVARDGGILKRFRGTPLPTYMLLGAKIVYSVFVGFVLVGVMLLLGGALFGATVQPGMWLAFIGILVVGCATFATLGIAVTALIPRADSAAAVVQASVLPLMFVSDVFFPLYNAPAWLQVVASVFPIKHFSSALQQVFNPHLAATGFEPQPLLVMGVWFVFGLLMARLFFRWEARR